MHHYIHQLLEDLEAATGNPPVLPFIEIPPHMQNEPVAGELALVPFKPISEWTGIDTKVFPEMHLLTVEQMDKVGQLMLKVLDSIGVEIVDLPPDLPPELLYDILIYHWDELVQYLPSSGYDLELCTGDPHTCPYGELCNCISWDDEASENRSF